MGSSDYRRAFIPLLIASCCLTLCSSFPHEHQSLVQPQQKSTESPQENTEPTRVPGPYENTLTPLPTVVLTISDSNFRDDRSATATESVQPTEAVPDPSVKPPGNVESSGTDMAMESSTGTMHQEMTTVPNVETVQEEILATTLMVIADAAEEMNGVNSPLSKKGSADFKAAEQPMVTVVPIAGETVSNESTTAVMGTSRTTSLASATPPHTETSTMMDPTTVNATDDVRSEEKTTAGTVGNQNETMVMAEGMAEDQSEMAMTTHEHENCTSGDVANRTYTSVTDREWERLRQRLHVEVDTLESVNPSVELRGHLKRMLDELLVGYKAKTRLLGNSDDDGDEEDADSKEDDDDPRFNAFAEMHCVAHVKVTGMELDSETEMEVQRRIHDAFRFSDAHKRIWPRTAAQS